MKKNLRAKEALTIENSPETDVCSESEVNPNPSSGLDQQMSNLTIENKFHISPGSILIDLFLTQPINHIRSRYWNIFWKKRKLYTLDGALTTTHG